MPFGPAIRPAGQSNKNGLKAVYPSWTRSYNTWNNGTWPGNDQSAPSHYEQFVTAMTSDERFQREVTLGKRIGLYKFRGELGTGNFARVKLAFHQLAHERVAVKIIEKTGMEPKALTMLSREIANMDTLRHPAIVRFFEAMETISKVYLVMEVAPIGEMYTRITNDGRYDEKKAGHLFSQLVSAVQFMHDNGLYHRDIKAENVFLLTPDHVRLGDFGFSTRVINVAEQQSHMLTTFCGSPPYAAPELFYDDAYSGAAVDIWALGVLLFFMVTATMPFQGQTVAGLKQSILDNCYFVPDYLGQDCVSLIRAIFTRDPAERITMTGIQDSEFLRGHPKLEPLPAYHFVPSETEKERTQLETTVLARLEELGISESMLMEHRDKGGRSAVIGTYRILMYRASCDKAEMDEKLSNNSGITRLEKEVATEKLAAPSNANSKASSKKSLKSNRSTKSNRSAVRGFLETEAMPVNEENQTNNNHKQPELTTSPTSAKAKFKHKLRFSLRDSAKKKAAASPVVHADASSHDSPTKTSKHGKKKKEKSVSNMCTIL